MASHVDLTTAALTTVPVEELSLVQMTSTVGIDTPLSSSNDTCYMSNLLATSFVTHSPGILLNLVVLQVQFSLLNAVEILYYKVVDRVQRVTEDLECNFQYLTFLVCFKLT